jgi:hypothetical protein
MHFKEIRSHEHGVNIPPYERIITSVLGLGAIAFGVREQNPLGWALAALGVGLAARGLSGRCPMTRQLARRAQAHRFDGEKDKEATRSMGESRSEPLGGLGSSISPQM